MDFKEILEELSPKMKGIAQRLDGHLRFMDDDDLIQEMFIHLWKKWKQGEVEGKTKSYLLQSCWFYLKNYLRIVSDKAKIINLDEPIDGGQMSLGELIPDNSQPIDESIAYKTLIEEIRTNGLTKREKEIFELRLEGYTMREIRNELGISHQRVVKVQQNICKKWNNRVF